jgi:hypothetical protein
MPISFFGRRGTSVSSTRLNFFHCYKDQRMKDEKILFYTWVYYKYTEGLWKILGHWFLNLWINLSQVFGHIESAEYKEVCCYRSRLNIIVTFSTGVRYPCSLPIKLIKHVTQYCTMYDRCHAIGKYTTVLCNPFPENGSVNNSDIVGNGVLFSVGAKWL